MEIKVPTTINDIPLGEYQRFAKVNVPDADPEFLMHKTIEIFCEMDIRDVARLPIKTAQDLYQEISEVLVQENVFTRRMTLEGVEYGFIPDLEAMTLGEYIDLEDGLKDAAQFHKAVSVMYRPIKKSYADLYTIEPYTASKSAHDVMKQAPLGEVNAAIVFFYHIVSELLEASQTFSKKQAKETLTTLEKDSSLLNTGGSTVSMLSLMETLRSMQQQQK